jgi:hypothetical protein
VVFHEVGKFFSSETPLPPGPRHCGQLALKAIVANEVKTKTVIAGLIA